MMLKVLILATSALFLTSAVGKLRIRPLAYQPGECKAMMTYPEGTYEGQASNGRWYLVTNKKTRLIDPSISPTQPPTVAPSLAPTYGPTVYPTYSPTIAPTLSPSEVPSQMPTTTAPTPVPHQVLNVAGNGNAALCQLNLNGVVATNAGLPGTSDLDYDSNGILYISVCGQLLKIVAGLLVVVAGVQNGGGTPSYSYYYDVAATSISLANNFAAIWGDDIYVTYQNTHVILKVHVPTGMVRQFAGIGTPTITGDGGPCSSAGVRQPGDIFIDSVGVIYVISLGTTLIRKIDTSSIITTVVGHANAGGGVGVAATSVGFANMFYLTTDTTGVLYFTSAARVFQVTPSDGIVRYYAGTGVRSPVLPDDLPATSTNLPSVEGVLVHPITGNFYVVTGKILMVDKTTSLMTTFAGQAYNSQTSGTGGPAELANLYNPSVVTIDNALQKLVWGEAGNVRSGNLV